MPKISAKVAQDVYDMSALGVFAHSFGVLTGAMAGDLQINLGNADATLVISQMLLLDGGDKRLISGSCQADDEKSVFLAMADGTIDRLTVEVLGNDMTAEWHEASSDELDHATAFQIATESIDTIVDAALEKSGKLEDGDEPSGNISMSTHEAIRNFITAKVTIVVKRAGKYVKGFMLSLEHVPAAISLEDAVSLSKLEDLLPADIDAEVKRHTAALGFGNAFNAPTGIA